MSKNNDLKQNEKDTNWEENFKWDVFGKLADELEAFWKLLGEEGQNTGVV